MGSLSAPSFPRHLPAHGAECRGRQPLVIAPVIIRVVLTLALVAAGRAPFVPASAVPPASRAQSHYPCRRGAVLVSQYGVQFGHAMIDRLAVENGSHFYESPKPTSKIRQGRLAFEPVAVFGVGHAAFRGRGFAARCALWKAAQRLRVAAMIAARPAALNLRRFRGARSSDLVLPPPTTAGVSAAAAMATAGFPLFCADRMRSRNRAIASSIWPLRCW